MVFPLCHSFQESPFFVPFIFLVHSARVSRYLSHIPPALAFGDERRPSSPCLLAQTTVLDFHSAVRTSLVCLGQQSSSIYSCREDGLKVLRSSFYEFQAGPFASKFLRSSLQLFPLFFFLEDPRARLVVDVGRFASLRTKAMAACFERLSAKCACMP